MTESQLLEWVCKLAECEAKRRNMTPAQKPIFDARIKKILDIKNKLKRIDYFGGVESLIAKASIVGQSEQLFPATVEENH